jgi:spore coat polysaccharide biosynthesis protein SpsF
MNEQEDFWVREISSAYRTDNDSFDMQSSMVAWQKMINSLPASEINSFLECGSNIGRNVGTLAVLAPGWEANVIEISTEALRICTERYQVSSAYNGSIKESNFDKMFDLVFSCGVLIHISPEDLLETMQKMYNHSSRYILVAEYFSRTPESIVYRGELNKLFKRDFGKLFVENFPVKVLDCGFLWSYEYENAGFDDITYWLFEK